MIPLIPQSQQEALFAFIWAMFGAIDMAAVFFFISLACAAGRPKPKMPSRTLEGHEE